MCDLKADQQASLQQDETSRHGLRHWRETEHQASDVLYDSGPAQVGKKEPSSTGVRP